MPKIAIFEPKREKMSATTIEFLSKHTGKTVDLQGWLMGKRTGKGLAFLVMRDGSGMCQCVVDEQEVSPEVFEDARRLTQESSFRLTGSVVADERQMGGV